MNRAIPRDSGSAMSSARKADHMVPKTSGATYAQKLDGEPLSSLGSAVSAGRLWASRKIATANRASRMMTPAVSANPEKMRSAGRCGAFGDAVAVVIV